MAEELTLRFFADGKDLKDVLMTQNEAGNYWLKDGALARFVLKDFDKAHKGYIRKDGGSHKPYPNEQALDFSLAGGTKLTSNKSLKLVRELFIKGYKIPYGLEWVYGNHHIITYHCTTTCKVGQYVEAGKVFATVMTPALNKASGRFDKDYPNGFPSHLHIGTFTTGSFAKTTIRQFILAPIVAPTPPTPPVVVPEPPVVTPEPEPPVNQPPTPQEQIKALETKLELAIGFSNKYLTDIANISALLGVVYDGNEDWSLQQYKYQEALQTLTDRATLAELLNALLHKFITKR